VSDRCVTRWYRGRLPAESLCYNLTAALGHRFLRKLGLIMRRSGRKLSLIAGLTGLFLLGTGAGCRGFFVSPSLTSITITPSTVSLAVGQAQPLVATGNYDDGTTKNLTGLATWTSSDTSGTFVHLSSTGVVTGVSTTTSAVTITATYKGISGTATVTVGQTQTITITCNSCTPGTNTISTAAVGAGGTVTFTASASANWSSSDSSVITISTANSTTGTGTLGGTLSQVTITATAASGTGSGTLVVTVTQ
jgi:hypothetical protein